VKFPEPVHPAPVPVSVHVPETVLLLFAVPCNDSLLLPFEPVAPDCTVSVNAPMTVPLKLPLKLKPPVSVDPEPKHGELVVNLKFVTVSSPVPIEVSTVVKPNTALPFTSSNVALQFPLIELLGFELEFPQAPSTNATASNPASLIGLMLTLLP